MVRNAAAVVATLAGLGVASAADKHGFHVIAPSEGTTVLADRTYTVEWIGNFAESLVDIDLYYCGSDCQEDKCGDWVASLCPYERGCPDNEGDFNIVMPKPMSSSRPGGMYKVRVMDANDESNWSCSGGFELLSVEDVVIDDEADWEPGMTVTSPKEGDLAYAGDTYTVHFDYFNELGSRVGRFNIDLYESDGGDGCDGMYVRSICDKPSIGCKDSQGDYNVEIPKDTPEGYYKVLIGPFDDVSTFGCSGEFIVTSDSEEGPDDVTLDEDDLPLDDDEDMSLSFSFYD